MSPRCVSSRTFICLHYSSLYFVSWPPLPQCPMMPNGRNIGKVIYLVQLRACCRNGGVFKYRIISNISTVLYFFNVPPPRAINGDVPLLETVPLLFQPHFRGMLPWPNSCQTHTFQGFFASTDNEFTQCAYETEHCIFRDNTVANKGLFSL